MRDGDVPRFFLDSWRSATGKAQLVGQLAAQLAGPANPANPSFSGKVREEGRIEKEGMKGAVRMEREELFV